MRERATVQAVTKSVDTEALRAFGERIRNARIGLGYKQDWIGTKIGVKGSYITKLEKGRQVPSPEVLRDLAKLLKLDEEELAFILAPAAAVRVPERFRQFITIVRHPEMDVAPRARSGTREEGRFPIYGLSSCGAMIEAIKSDRLPHGEQRTTEPWPEAVEAAKSKRAFAVKAEGASMEPTIHDGDEVLIDPRAPRVNGCIVLLQVKGEVTLKRWKEAKGTVILTPDNEDRDEYPELIFSGEEWEAEGGTAWRAILTRSTRKL